MARVRLEGDDAHTFFIGAPIRTEDLGEDVVVAVVRVELRLVEEAAVEAHVRADVQEDVRAAVAEARLARPPHGPPARTRSVRLAMQRRDAV